MERYEILDDLEKLQDYSYEQGFMGSNERELFFRESITDYILSKLHLPTVIKSVCVHEWYDTENHYTKCRECNKMKE